MVGLVRVDGAFKELHLRCSTGGPKCIHKGFLAIQIHLDWTMIAVEVTVERDARACREIMSPAPITCSSFAPLNTKLTD